MKIYRCIGENIYADTDYKLIFISHHASYYFLFKGVGGGPGVNFFFFFKSDDRHVSSFQNGLNHLSI